MTPVTIDIAPSGKLRLGFINYEIDIPASDAGLYYIIGILQARHNDASARRVGMPGAPTQAQVDEFFKRKAQKEEKDLGLGETPTLEELGL